MFFVNFGPNVSNERGLLVQGLPSYAPDEGRHRRGGFVFDRAIASLGRKKWWATFTGRFRIQVDLSTSYMYDLKLLVGEVPPCKNLDVSNDVTCRPKC